MTGDVVVAGIGMTRCTQSPELSWEDLGQHAVLAAMRDAGLGRDDDYFGYRPFKIGLMPVGLIASNVACVIVPTLLIYRFYPVMTGWRRLAAVGLIPVGTIGAWSAVHAPMSNVLGTDTEANHALVQAGAVMTVVLSVFVAWVSISLAESGARPTAPAPAGGPDGRASTTAA